MPLDDLDAKDWEILARLQGDARIANVDLARAVHLSPSPCLARVRRLEAAGLINRYVTLLDPRKLGLGVSVFISVRLERQIEKSLETFERAILARPEVMECYLMTGESDYLLRVVVQDVAALERLVRHMQGRPGVEFVMQGPRPLFQRRRFWPQAPQDGWHGRSPPAETTAPAPQPDGFSAAIRSLTDQSPYPLHAAGRRSMLANL